MIQVWKYDKDNIFTESCRIEELEENMTTVPLLVGYIKPKFDKDKQEWYEGATEEEIQKWKDENEKVDKTKISPTTDELKEENERLWETVEFLLKQVNMIPKES